jgi:hypothetical protein
MPQLQMGVLRLLAQPLGDMVLDAAVWEPDQDTVLLSPPTRGRTVARDAGRTVAGA